MSYPEYLIPTSESIFINELEDNDILCRGVRGNVPLQDEMGKLSALAVDEVRIPGYSTNKIPPSNIDDIKLSINSTELSRTYWKEGKEGYTLEDSQFTKIESRQHFLIRIGDINKYSARFPYPFSQNSDDYECQFNLNVVHAPLLVNCSHCEFHFRFFQENNKEFDKPSKKSYKVICASVRQKLIEIAKFGMSDFD